MDAQASEDASDFPHDRTELITLLNTANSATARMGQGLLTIAQWRSEYEKEKGELLQMNLDSAREHSKALRKNIDLTKKNSRLLKENTDLRRLMNNLTEALEKISQEYLAFLKNETGYGLGCFVGGVLLSITLCVEPKWFLKKFTKK